MLAPCNVVTRVANSVSLRGCSCLERLVFNDLWIFFRKNGNTFLCGTFSYIVRICLRSSYNLFHVKIIKIAKDRAVVRVRYLVLA